MRIFLFVLMLIINNLRKTDKNLFYQNQTFNFSDYKLVSKVF